MKPIEAIKSQLMRPQPLMPHTRQPAMMVPRTTVQNSVIRPPHAAPLFMRPTDTNPTMLNLPQKRPLHPVVDTQKLPATNIDL